MTKGSGRSACFRGGVTYGYREYLRKGRVRKSCDASSPVNDGSTDLRRAYLPQQLNQNDLCRFFAFSKSPHLLLKKMLPGEFLRPYIEKYCRRLALNLVPAL